MGKQELGWTSGGLDELVEAVHRDELELLAGPEDERVAFLVDGEHVAVVRPR